MRSDLPDEADLERRIRDHLSWRPESDVPILLWEGYLAALLEWGRIPGDAYGRLTRRLLPPIANKESAELFAHARNTPEEDAMADAAAAKLAAEQGSYTKPRGVLGIPRSRQR